ncbi:MAG: DUF3604 domain-containing protein [Anaerolineales bacterium]|nr:DUF3604 domain-containing protein [Anaerolineales bacterium]
MTTQNATTFTFGLSSFLYFVALSVLAPASTARAEPPYSPPVSKDYPLRVFWGDTHLHTALSGDAYLYSTRLGPDAAYRFAKGELVTSTTGQPVKLDRPLDFLVVADHANNMGAAYSRGSFLNDPKFPESTLGRLWEKARSEVLEEGLVDAEELKTDRLYTVHIEGLVSVRHTGFRQTIWESITETADRHDEPGRFTAFNGYEWTPQRGAVHRVVIFRDDGDRVNQILPFSSYDSGYVEDLWEFLEAYERDTGGSVLAIPHNSNLTSGLMFDLRYSSGEPFDDVYVRARARWEPLLEVTQIKGDSETHPKLSPDDPFADFETWNGWGGRGPNPNRPDDKIQFEYARSALKLGLEQLEKHGGNPFKFGLIGSTDSHTALATAAENNSWGKFANDEPGADRFFKWPGWQASAAGYAAVWATENTREAIFDAMRRKETYASTGPRMAVRFFGGWDFTEPDAQRPNLAGIGYAKGVPMGGDLSNGPAGKSPNFLIRAVKDPEGANLDRVQVIKGWHDAQGELHEKIYNVALSDGRRVRQNGSAEPVGSTVDAADASYTNSIGDPELAAVWTDPDFAPDELAFYYVRVLEIPTPRWTAYDAKFYGLKDLPDTIPMVIQERVYTSPIWYTPA